MAPDTVKDDVVVTLQYKLRLDDGTLVEESERKQQRELALRVAQVIREVNAQREADLVKIVAGFATPLID